MELSDIQAAKARLGIVGNAPGLQRAVARALKVAPIDLSVLVTGESGSGKEFFPQLIHAYSPRKHARYIAVNCGAIPEGTIDSELFGHEKGAFTGAVASRKGYFEEADGGTVFLDEVAELPLTTQARLLRVLETGEYLKVGSSTVQRTNIRVVAATNVDMAKAVAEGRFREDLYYRLATIEIAVPPLRDRGDDIRLLARKFAADMAERYRLPAVQLTDEAQLLLEHFRWPGNVRQLKNVVEQLAVLEAGNNISRATLLQYLPQGDMSYTPAVAQPRTGSYENEREALFNLIFRLQREIEQLRQQIHAAPAADAEPIMPTMPTVPTALVKYAPTVHAEPTVPYVEVVDSAKDIPSREAPKAPEMPQKLEATERQAIIAALERNNGQRRAAARQLGISERTLYRRILQYDLEK